MRNRFRNIQFFREFFKKFPFFLTIRIVIFLTIRIVIFHWFNRNVKINVSYNFTIFLNLSTYSSAFHKSTQNKIRLPSCAGGRLHAFSGHLTVSVQELQCAVTFGPSGFKLSISYIWRVAPPHRCRHGTARASGLQELSKGCPHQHQRHEEWRICLRVTRMVSWFHARTIIFLKLLTSWRSILICVAIKSINRFWRDVSIF